MLFVAPMWINFTLRVVALKEVLTMIEGNLAYHPFLNTVLGMTTDFLPFMILPLYTTLSKLDKSYLEAATDLGSKSGCYIYESNISTGVCRTDQWNYNGILTIYDKLRLYWTCSITVLILWVV